MAPVRSEISNNSPDLELLAQRLLKLAEVATMEHLEVLMNSQAHSMLELFADGDD